MAANLATSCHEYTFHRLCLPQVSRAGGSVAIEGTLVFPVVEELRVSDVVLVNTISSSRYSRVPSWAIVLFSMRVLSCIGLDTKIDY